METRQLIAGVLPGVVLGAILLGGLLWEHSGQVPKDVEFARPLVSLLRANGVGVTRVAHASHYELQNSIAASITTDRGYVGVLQFESESAARAGVDEAATWCCGLFFTLDGRRFIFTDDPELARRIKRAIERAVVFNR